MIIGNRYEVIEKIHKGSWSTIYKVKDIRDNQTYVLKLFSELSSQDFYSRFSAEELTILTKIKHPNLIRTYDFGIFAKNIYSVSSFYDLPPLSKYLFLKISDIFTIIKGICLGLSALHKENLLHQNLRLENILYNPHNMQVKILDCNFVDIELSKQEIFVDYLPYLAPEVYDRQKPSIQSDLYSFGIVLYYITCGRFPFSIHQIQNLQNTENYYPTPPSKINPQVPAILDTLILRLLNRFPQERFTTAMEIVDYINDYSPKEKIVLSPAESSLPFGFGRGTIHKKYYQQLLANLKTVHQQKNGKILHIIGDCGIGKSTLLKQFRYSILDDIYSVFYYKCSKENTDPLFTVAKETMSKESLNTVAKEFSHISTKYKKFLIDSEKEALAIPDSEENVEIDTEFIKKTLFAASNEKTLVIIIENIDYLKNKTIKALDIISKSINSHPIFLILSGDKHNTIDSVVHKNKKFIPNLNYEETKNFVLALTKGVFIHQDIIELIIEKSAGNPKFIKKILVQLHQDKLLQQTTIPSDYSLPSTISSNIKQTILESLSKQPCYDLIKKMAFFTVPITSQSIHNILKINQKDVCFLLSDLIDAHIVHHEKESYNFNSKQIKNCLKQQLSSTEKNTIATNAFAYYKKQPVKELEVAEGLLEYAFYQKNFDEIRYYSLLCAELHLAQYQYQEAYHHFFQIGKLHALGYLPKELWQKDLQTLTLNSKLNSLKTLQLLSQFPKEETKKLRAILLQDARKSDLAEELFEQIKLGSSQLDNILQIKKIRNKLILNKLDQAAILLEDYHPNSLKGEVYKIIMRAELLLKKSNPTKATIVLQEFIKSHDLSSLSQDYILAKLYQLLSNCLHIQRHLEEAEKHYLLAQSILQKSKYLIGLCNNYIDLGGLYLTKGDIGKALKYLKNAKRISENYPHGKLRVSYSYGKAYLKLGKFEKAVEHFEIAKKVCLATQNKKRYEMCQMHISSCILKCKGYGEFYQYVQNFRPEIFDWQIESFNPLVRTFFLYLIATGQSLKLEQKMEENSHIYFKNKDHYEHYYSLLGSIAYHKKEYNLAITHFEHAINMIKNKHNYAHGILLYKLCKVYTDKGDYRNSANVCQKLDKLCQKYKFGYWQSHATLEKLKIELFSQNISYRQAFKKAQENLTICLEKNYFVQALEYYCIIIKILDFYNLTKKAKKYFTQYKSKIDEICQGLPEEVAKKVEKRYHYLGKDFSKLLSVNFAPEKKIKITDEQENFLKILEIRDIERIKFFVWQTIKKFFAPSGFLILIDGEPFFNHNVSNQEVNHYQEIFLQQTKPNFNKNCLWAPLQVDRTTKGLLILINDSEIPYKIKEKNLFKKLLPYLSYVIFQSTHIDQIQSQKKLLHKMMNLNILGCVDTKQIMANILTFLIEITEAKRGFWIEKDYINSISGANLWRLGLDDQGRFVPYQNFVSNYLIDTFEKRKNFFKISSNLVSDKSFVQTLQRFSVPEFEIMLYPIILDNKIDSFLYLDTYQAEKNSAKLVLNKSFMHTFTDYIDKMLQTFKLNQKLKIQLENQQKVIHTKTTAIKLIEGNFLQPLEATKKLLQKPSAETDKASFQLSLLQHSISSAFYFNHLNDLKYLSPLSYNIKELCQKILDRYKYLTKNLQIKFSLTTKTLKINKKTLLLILDNILLNSLQNAQTYIEIGTRNSKFDNERIENKDSLIFFVRNDGQIPDKQEIEQSIDQPFLQGSRNSALQENNQSLGIGLNLCKSIAEKMNGKIWLFVKDKHTTCYLALPFTEQKKVAKVDE